MPIPTPIPTPAPSAPTAQTTNVREGEGRKGEDAPTCTQNKEERGKEEKSSGRTSRRRSPQTKGGHRLLGCRARGHKPREGRKHMVVLRAGGLRGSNVGVTAGVVLLISPNVPFLPLCPPPHSLALVMGPDSFLGPARIALLQSPTTTATRAPTGSLNTRAVTNVRTEERKRSGEVGREGRSWYVLVGT